MAFDAGGDEVDTLLQSLKLTSLWIRGYDRPIDVLAASAGETAEVLQSQLDEHSRVPQVAMRMAAAEHAADLAPFCLFADSRRTMVVMLATQDGRSARYAVVVQPNARLSNPPLESVKDMVRNASMPVLYIVARDGHCEHVASIEGVQAATALSRDTAESKRPAFPDLFSPDDEGFNDDMFTI